MRAGEAVPPRDPEILGLHHVTAIAGDPQANVDFYAGILGLRLVKRTVNFDDPTTYHLYYGDGTGRPGTLLTFFPWPGAPRGRPGAGQVATTTLAVPDGSLDFWRRRLEAAGISVDGPRRRLGETVLALRDPDDMEVELVEGTPTAARAPWTGGPVAADRAVRGIAGVSLREDGFESTAALLTARLGMREGDQEGDRFRFLVGRGEEATAVDLLCRPGTLRGRVAVGSVHHVAWRVAGPEEQERVRDGLVGRGLNVTPVLDRRYFRSIYFREPGGVLFEVATDTPGFTIDEAEHDLGRSLALPPWLEGERERIEAALPELDPGGNAEPGA